MSKLSRFLHLERARGERPQHGDGAAPLRDKGRFESPQERREAPQEAAVPEAHLERFKGEAPLALGDVPEEARRFPRCAVCEAENGRFAKACGVCGADLGTPEQLEYNERLWQQRRQELSRTRADEVEALRRNEEQRRREQEALADRMLEQLRRQQAEDGPLRAFLKRSAVGTALLSFTRGPVDRFLTLLTLALLPVFLWRHGGWGARLGALVLALVFASLFVPRGPGPRR
jgi:hypothetical protein